MNVSTLQDELGPESTLRINNPPSSYPICHMCYCTLHDVWLLKATLLLLQSPSHITIFPLTHPFVGDFQLPSLPKVGNRPTHFVAWCSESSSHPPVEKKKKKTPGANGSIYGGFLNWGYPKKSSILVGFSLINHAFWGKPPWLWKPPCYV